DRYWCEVRRPGYATDLGGFSNSERVPIIIEPALQWTVPAFGSNSINSSGTHALVPALRQHNCDKSQQQPSIP
ncbi:MAG: hypothetical protein J2P54_15605, partial [Bradyrhizobiaceae bacterium]|nr:hypothetical protein [Bradyrhizobiaceae bacterium]